MILSDDFARHFEAQDALPEQLVIDIARVAYPDLDAAAYVRTLDEFAHIAGAHMARTAGGQATAQEFLHIICDELGFHGASEGYYDARNSLLPDVLARRQGLPIMLALLCMAIGRRIDLHVEGLGFPFHFMAFYQDASGGWLLAPFYGAVVGPADANDYLARIVRRPFQLDASAWAPVSAQMLAVRVLNNLRNAYMSAGNHALTLRTLDLLVAVQAHERHYWRERGLLHFKLENWEQAQHDLRYYLIRSGLFPRMPGDAGEAAPLTDEDRRVVERYRTCGEMLMRVN